MPVRRGQLLTPERSKPVRLVYRFSIAAAVSVVVVMAMQFGLRHVVSQQDTDLAGVLPTEDVAVTETAARRIYPYSIVAGGVQSSTEVARAMADDVTVAAHYAGLEPSRLRVEHVAGPERAYVSYRIGDRVYWTRHAITLQGGEAILTDGVAKLRARCGNRLSDVPQQPVSPDEPDEAAFEQFDGLSSGPKLDLLAMNSLAPLVTAGESNPSSPFLHGSLAPYLGPFALVGPLDPDDGSSAVIGGPPIDMWPIDEGSLRPDRIPEPSPAGDADPASIFSHGSPEAFLMPTDLIDPIDPGDPYIDSHVDIGDTRGGESLTPVPEPGTVTLLGIGLSAAVCYARRRRGDPTVVD